ncbi:MAG: HDOD domain-containing protein [Planctomycetaceae bacterium]|nr:HDOD domain-containing protein [Planctomycetaceae bacterium]
MIDWSGIRASALGKECSTDNIPNVQLPVLPAAVAEFSQKADDPDCSIDTLSAIVESDTGLTCQLLRSVNASNNGLKHRIVSPRHAIAALGIRRTKLHLITAALQNSLPARKLKLINLPSFWNANLERALFARRLARLLKTDEELAFAAGLLQDFLIPVLTNELDHDYVHFMSLPDADRTSLVDFEAKTFEWDHAGAAANVMFDWGFPDDLICCVFFHHRGLSVLADEQLGHSAAAAVALAGLMPDSIRQSPGGLLQLEKLAGIWDGFDLQAVAKEVFDEYEPQALESANYIPFKVHCEKLLETAAANKA